MYAVKIFHVRATDMPGNNYSYVKLVVDLFKMSLYAETHSGPDGTRL